MGGDDPFDLRRFVEAQSRSGTYDRALSELRAGRKTSHWMWFVFPQLSGLGRSQMARAYAISSIAEARAYLDHPTLGPRLRDCCRALLSIEQGSAVDVLGAVDAVKLRSSMTLFAKAGDETLFFEVLDRYYGGIGDPETERRI
jgi:uncharacterized protein (DUF1810 family)